MEPKDVTYLISKCYISDQTDVDSEIKAKVLGFNRARDFRQLSTCSYLYDAHLHSIVEWRFLRQIEAFFKKNALFADKDKCFDAALSSFKESEAGCSSTNLRLKRFIVGERRTPFKLAKQISLMQRHIDAVLGPFAHFLGDLPNLVKVTPGATAQSSRRDSLPQLKLKLKLFCTKGAQAYLRAVLASFGFDNLRCRMTYSNRIELVPKNWKTDRTIACEPEGNLPLQLAFDTYAKRKLKRFGIDLADQSANQRRAKHASIHDDYVTVDFKAASDTISYNTVAWLLPYDWFDFLRRTRSPLYRGVFGQGKYSKFSSMGNGVTFCLETLIFAAACHAVGSRNYLVYGDDVIIEKKFWRDYKQLTRFLGFTINSEKSFADGPFRESCGGDYFDGIDVTPVYIRGIDRRKAIQCHLINTLGRLTFPGSSLGELLASISRSEKLPRVPFNESTLSGVWISPGKARSLGILRKKVLRSSGPRLNYFKSYTAMYKRRNFVDSRGYYLWFLYKRAQALFSGPWEAGSPRYDPLQTSSVPIFQHKYVRKWVSWQPPAEATPDHLLWLEP